MLISLNYFGQTTETIPRTPEQNAQIQHRLNQISDTVVRNSIPQGVFMKTSDFEAIIKEKKRKNSLVNSSKK